MYRAYQNEMYHPYHFEMYHPQRNQIYPQLTSANMVGADPNLSIQMLSLARPRPSMLTFISECWEQVSAYNEATVDVNYCGQIHKAFLHGNVCDINAPHLIPMVNRSNYPSCCLRLIQLYIASLAACSISNLNLQSSSCFWMSPYKSRSLRNNRPSCVISHLRL